MMAEDSTGDHLGASLFHHSSSSRIRPETCSGGGGRCFPIRTITLRYRPASPWSMTPPAMASTVCSNFAVTRKSGSKAMNCSLPDGSTVSQLIGQRVSFFQDSGHGAYALWTMLFGQPLVKAVEILQHALQ